MEPDAGAHYRAGRLALTALLRDRPPEAWAQPVPACPGWDVRGAVSHLLGIVEDAMAGRLTGPPDDAQVAAQLARHADGPPDVLLDEWDDVAPVFEDIVSRGEIWVVVFDVLAHTHDVRGALGEPGDRDGETVQLAARALVAGADLPVTLGFDVGDDVLTTAGAGPAHVVRTTPFEVTRIRLGRRSPEQVATMAWEPPLPDVPPALFVFGPRETPLVE